MIQREKASRKIKLKRKTLIYSKESTFKVRNILKEMRRVKSQKEHFSMLRSKGG